MNTSPESTPASLTIPAIDLQSPDHRGDPREGVLEGVMYRCYSGPPLGDGSDDGRIIAWIVACIRLGITHPDDIVDWIDDNGGEPGSDRAHALIYEHAGPAIDSLWSFNEFGGLHFPYRYGDAIPVMN